MNFNINKISILLIGVVLLAVLGVSGASAAATVDSGICGDNLTWVLTDDGTLTISGTGAMYDYSLLSKAPWYQYRSQMTKLVLQYGLTKIGDWTFYDCSKFAGSLIIPSSVTTIGMSAFSGCSGFTGLLTLPDSVTTIDQNAFAYCTGFSGSLTIPDSVTTIGDSAFQGCSGFDGALTLPKNITTINYSAFSTCNNLIGFLRIPNMVTTIGDYGFFGCGAFTSITIPANTTKIGNCAFDSLSSNSIIYAECPASLLSEKYTASRTALASKGIDSAYTFTVDTSSFPSGYLLSDDNSPITQGKIFVGWYTNPSYTGEKVTSVSNGQTLYAKWTDCSGIIDSGKCGDNLTWVLTDDWTLTISGTGDMYNYTSGGAPWYKYRSLMTALKLANGITTIGNNTFNNCKAFTGQLHLPASIITIGDYAFSGCSSFTESLILSDTIKTIGNFAFGSCTGFNKSLYLPEDITTIGVGTFFGCHGFTGSLNLPENLTMIGEKTFAFCRGFTGSLIIPDNVTTIGEGAFTYCSGFSDLFSLPKNLITIGERSFQECGGFTKPISIPNGTKDIGYATFSYCSGLPSVTVPSSITEIGEHAFAFLKTNSIIYAECPGLLLSGTYSSDKTVLSASGANNAYTFVINSTHFPSGFSLTDENAPTKSGTTFAGWYNNPSYFGEKVTTVTNGQTLYAKWSGGDDGLILHLGWNVVSVPKKLAAMYDTAAELFADVDTAEHAILSYNSSTKSWEQVTASTKIEPLNAYWIYSSTSTSLPYEFSSTVSSPAMKNVYKGWNAVGVSAEEPIAAYVAFGNTKWYTYLEWNATSQKFNTPLVKDGSGIYADTNLVSLWTGGWLYVNEDGTYIGFTS